MKKYIKLTALLLALVMVLCLGLSSCGKKEPKNAAYVTLTNAAELGTDKSGNYVAAVAVEVPAEGTTVGDVIKALHKTYSKGGEADYATSTGQYGEQIDKLWGVENGGAYGYYINGNMAMGLTDPVKVGDYVDVFIYKDTTNYSDAYVALKAEVNGKTVKVTAEAMGFDANWNPAFTPLKGAKIYTVDGKKLTDTGAVTGEDGTASFELKAGSYTIVAINTDGTYTVGAVRVTTK